MSLITLTTNLLNITPIDGRYSSNVTELQQYFSEFAYFRYRVYIEIEYLIYIAKIFKVQVDNEKLRNCYLDFSLADAEKIKELESVTQHDVKACEYFIKDMLSDDLKEFVHLGLTSQDINNTALPLMIKDSTDKVIIPLLSNIIMILSDMGDKWIDIPMLARTHGQPATPTRLGKEMLVFVERLSHELLDLISFTYSGKFGGATGCLNSLYCAFPSHNWCKLADEFLESLHLSRQQYTTQIEHYDGIAKHLCIILRICTILINFCRDMWQYISYTYFTLPAVPGEIGSSTMPHKINPINFENAEGNLGLASSLCIHLITKLPISRLQRDLTDSPVTRNIGSIFAYVVIALKSIEKGLGKVELNKQQLYADLENNWVIISEGVQTILRKYKYPKPYELLAQFTRTHTHIKNLCQQDFYDFYDTLDVTDKVKDELRQLSPHTYIGDVPRT